MSRVQLLTRYRLGTERALEQADFLNNPNITVLQALTIYLAVLQHTGESRSAWLLVGVLIRVAISMKLHRDGSHFDNITLFEVEMRRRLWWQICFLDSRSVDRQISAFKMSEDMFDTHFPSNISDADLSPEIAIPHPINAKGRWTDMTVSLIHCEIWTLSQRLQSLTRTNASSPHNHINDVLKTFHQTSTTIESTYLSHLNLNIPLHAFIATTTRLSLTKISLILNSKHGPSHSSRTSPSSSSSSSSSPLSQSLSLLHLSTHLQFHPTFHPYRWSLHHHSTPSPSQGYQQQALHTVLTHLLAFTPSSSSPNQTWSPTHEQAYSTARAAAAAAGLSPFAQTPAAKKEEEEAEVVKRDPRYRTVHELLEKVEQRRRRHHHHHQQQQHGAAVVDGDADGGGGVMASLPTASTSTSNMTSNNNKVFTTSLLLPVLSPSGGVDTASGANNAVSSGNVMTPSIIGEELFPPSLPLSLSDPTPAPALGDIHSVNDHGNVNYDDDDGNPFSDDGFIPRLDRDMDMGWQAWDDGAVSGGGGEWDSDLNLGMWDWDWDLGSL